MEFLNLTRHPGIASNCYLLRIGGKSIVLDAGADPKVDGLGSTPLLELLPDGDLDAIIVTHAHQDHIGSLPVLTRQHQRSPVFMTVETAKIAEAMLHNSVNVMTRQREELNLHEYPLYTHRGVDFSEKSWVPCPLRQRRNLRGEPSDDDTEVTFEFFHAGHILGSVGVLIRHEGRSLFYTGDVNFDRQTLMTGADFPTEGVDVLVMETTRGDSPTPPGFSRTGEEERFSKAVREALARGATITIPVFALGKTQEVLAMLWSMRLRGEIGSIPIYVGGLSVKITTLYDQLATAARRSHPELQLLQELAPYVLSGREIEGTAPRKKAIYALSSGMMTEHTLSNIFARRVLGDPAHSLFFVGYSDPDSPSYRVRHANPGDEVSLDPAHAPVPVRCDIRQFSFSAHATRESLRNYATVLRPKKILLVHGDAPAMEWFQLALYRELPGTEVIIPERARAVTLG